MSPPPANSAAARIRLPRRLPRPRIPALPQPPRHAGRWLLGALVLAVAVLIAFHFWFRDSSFVSVNEVQISGATSADAGRLRTTLAGVARSMTTLDFDKAELERATASYPVVRGLEISADFPHTLRIRVLEHVPAAIAVIDGARVPVAGDGTLLRGVATGGSLPTLDARAADGSKLADPIALRAARVAGAAPVVLRRRLEDVTHESERGLVAHLRDGPELVFGGSRHARAKWIAAARVLADPEAQGASYIDVRLPSRPAVGGLGAASITPSPTATQTPPPVASTPSTDPSAGAASVTPDPSATGTTGTTDPSATGTTDPSVTGTTDPSATATTPPATGDPSATGYTQP